MADKKSSKTHAKPLAKGTHVGGHYPGEPELIHRLGKNVHVIH